jgi:hypothetical protein
LTTNEESRLSDYGKPGDRTLMYSIGDGVIVPQLIPTHSLVIQIIKFIF